MRILRTPKIGLGFKELLLGLLLFCLLIIMLPFKLMQWLLFLYRSRVCFLEVVYCPDHHPNAAYGTFECARCGSRFKGWIWQRCPTCQYSCGYISCEVCGLAIKNPLL